MSRNFELLKQLEESSPRSSSSPTADEWTDEPVQPPVDRPRRAPNSNIHEVPFHPSAQLKHSDLDKEIARLVESLLLSQKGREMRSLVFSSVEGGNASGFVCANAGRGLAARSELVCLVDTNLRERNLSRYLGLSSWTSAANESPIVTDHCVQLQNNLWFADTTLLTNSNGTFLQVDQLANVLRRLRASFHYVLFDTQSITESSDVALFGNLLDGAVLVIEAGVTRKQSARKAKELLANAAVPLIGTVLNNRTFPIPESLYRRI
jgi:Mrp family chromosome partitioning ATPase